MNYIHSEAIQDILNSIQEGRRILVLSQRREHCRLLMERLVSQGKKPFVLDGGVRKKDRLAIIDTIRSLPREEELVLIATGQYLGEGFDCPQLDTLFLVFPVAFKGKLVQYSGRLMRSFQGKNSVRVYDYVDGRMPLFKKMHAKRLKTYKEIGFLN